MLKKVKEVKEESTEERILLLLEFSKEMGEDNMKKENRYDTTTARRLYKSFEKMYSWMPYNKKWKLKHFYQMSIQDAEEIAHNWISTELNPVERENIW